MGDKGDGEWNPNERQVFNSKSSLERESSNVTNASNRSTESSSSSSSSGTVSLDSSYTTVPVAVERQTTLVLQGFFCADTNTEDERQNVENFFDTLEGEGRRSDSDEAIFQLGLQMNRAANQLRARHQEDFESMMADIGPTMLETLEGLAQIAMKLFSNPNGISWSLILTYVSFASYVCFKRGMDTLKGVWNTIVEKLSEFRVVKWIKEKGGWILNQDAINKELQGTDAVPELVKASRSTSISSTTTSSPSQSPSSINLPPPVESANSGSSGSTSGGNRIIEDAFPETVSESPNDANSQDTSFSLSNQTSSSSSTNQKLPPSNQSSTSDVPTSDRGGDSGAPTQTTANKDEADSSSSSTRNSADESQSWTSSAFSWPFAAVSVAVPAVLIGSYIYLRTNNSS